MEVGALHLWEWSLGRCPKLRKLELLSGSEWLIDWL